MDNAARMKRWAMQRAKAMKHFTLPVAPATAAAGGAVFVAIGAVMGRFLWAHMERQHRQWCNARHH